MIKPIQRGRLNIGPDSGEPETRTAAEKLLERGERIKGENHEEEDKKKMNNEEQSF